ncbi:protein kinase domain-containing protein [Streptomyces sp. G5(2025)]|uniref:protein kinase domain-containing protein n=1 Tax=Streptomyces sp. G5(2025) TaxID=3406628 RepID=UPI003C2228A4
MTASSHTTARRLIASVWGERAEAGAVLVAERRGTCLWRVDTVRGPYALKITVPCTDPQGHVDSERLALVEAEILLALAADGVLTGLYEAHGTLYDSEGSWLALKWAGGDDAETAFAKLRQAPDAAMAASYATAMCKAVADLHASGWRHGDLQEVHFILNDHGATLLDYAMAHAPDRRPGTGPVVYRGAYDWFMSPELARARLTTTPADDLPLTTASEVWSLCAVIYACWTGTYPISTRDTPQSTPELRAELALGRVKPWADTRPWPFAEFEDILTSGLQTDPTRRPTARALQYAFEALV